MTYITRSLEKIIQHTLAREKSILLFGARQTGKTTLFRRFSTDLSISFANPKIRLRYEKNPALLIGEIEALAKTLPNKPLVFVDEVQKVPDILDAIQYLIDNQTAYFIITGSSARKLKKTATLNLLPGRVISLRLEPLCLLELSGYEPSLEQLLVYGSLPGIFSVPLDSDKELDLQSYVQTYLEEEIRLESVVRNMPSFSRFLELAASESGNVLNLSKLSQEIGVAHTTISAYYQILVDCLIAERIEPFLKTKTRRKLGKSPKYLLFDLGLRRLAAHEGVQLPEKYKGWLFEQFIGLELIRHTRFIEKKYQVRFWRDLSGIEVDWVLEAQDSLIPIEVKWTDAPTLQDAKHLLIFLKEHPEAKNAYIVCQTPNNIKISEQITAVSWRNLLTVFDL